MTCAKQIESTSRFSCGQLPNWCADKQTMLACMCTNKHIISCNQATSTHLMQGLQTPELDLRVCCDREALSAQRPNIRRALDLLHKRVCTSLTNKS